MRLRFLNQILMLLNIHYNTQLNHLTGLARWLSVCFYELSGVSLSPIKVKKIILFIVYTWV